MIRVKIWEMWGVYGRASEGASSQGEQAAMNLPARPVVLNL